jgi:hypothetical protein
VLEILKILSEDVRGFTRHLFILLSHSTALLMHLLSTLEERIFKLNSSSLHWFTYEHALHLGTCTSGCMTRGAWPNNFSRTLRSLCSRALVLLEWEDRTDDQNRADTGKSLVVVWG